MSVGMSWSVTPCGVEADLDCALRRAFAAIDGEAARAVCERKVGRREVAYGCADDGNNAFVQQFGVSRYARGLFGVEIISAAQV